MPNDDLLMSCNRYVTFASWPPDSLRHRVTYPEPLHAESRGNGNQRWIKEIPTRPLLPPQTFGDGVKYEEIVVLTGATSELDAFAAKTGAPVGMYQPPPGGSWTRW